MGLVAAVLALAAISIAIRLMDNTTLPVAELITLAGKKTALPTLAAHKPMVVNLWATWCPPCRLELPFIAAAQRQEWAINFAFVDQGEDAETVERYLSAAHLDLVNVLLDSGNKLGREIGSPGLPVTLFYDSSGRMVDSHLGALSPAMLDRKLAPLRPPARNTAKE